jgi:segregation and condensation protein A
VNIYDIPIAEITEQYIQFIELATHISLEDLTDFYHLASTLIYIKSKMLLPIELDLDEELEDPRKELVAKLIEYQKFKKLTALMAEKNDRETWFMGRKKKDLSYPLLKMKITFGKRLRFGTS